MQRLTLAMTGMSCGHCRNAVNQALAELQFDPEVTDPCRIAAAVEHAGYGAVGL